MIKIREVINFVLYFIHNFCVFVYIFYAILLTRPKICINKKSNERNKNKQSEQASERKKRMLFNVSVRKPKLLSTTTVVNTADNEKQQST